MAIWNAYHDVQGALPTQKSVSGRFSLSASPVVQAGRGFSVAQTADPGEFTVTLTASNANVVAVHPTLVGAAATDAVVSVKSISSNAFIVQVSKESTGALVLSDLTDDDSEAVAFTAVYVTTGLPVT